MQTVCVVQTQTEPHFLTTSNLIKVIYLGTFTQISKLDYYLHSRQVYLCHSVRFETIISNFVGMEDEKKPFLNS